MIVFIIIFLLLGLLLLIENKSNKTFICISCFFIIWLIQALRAPGIGCDPFYTYIPHFESQGDVEISNLFITEDNYKFEPGYQICTRLIRLISTDIQTFLALTSLIILAPIAFCFSKLSKNIALSFIIFSGLILYHFSFSGLRQSIALAITLFSTFFIFKRKFLIYLGLILLAFFFHKSAIIFLPAYFLYNVTISRMGILFSALCLIILFISAGGIAEYIRLLVFGADKYAGYLGANVGAFGLTILYILLTVFVLYFSNWKNKHQNFLCWMAIATLMFQPLGLVSQAADRIGYYFLIYFSISIPNTIVDAKLDSSSKKIMKTIFYFAMIVIFCYCNAGGYLDVVPYRFFF